MNTTNERNLLKKAHFFLGCKAGNEVAAEGIADLKQQISDYLATPAPAMSADTYTQVGWFVVGDGKHGEYKLGQLFETDADENGYWKNRGYERVPAFAPQAHTDNLKEAK